MGLDRILQWNGYSTIGIERRYGGQKLKRIEIYTERLVIRQFCQKDADSYFKLLQNPRVHCFADEKIDSLEEANQEIMAKKDINDGTELAVCLKDTDEFIGVLCGLWEKDTFSVCWHFLPEYCGKGFAYESAKAYLDFLFNQLNARRIYAYVEDDNISSQRLCQRLGMRLEGVFKEFISFVNHSDGTPLYENTMQFAILKKEWNQK